ncbi:MAG TPA: hypothetical protein VEA37_07535, partial [Flavobacterium sp.]|nr:hypothetical protein [Flavobacterium sp.]
MELSLAFEKYMSNLLIFNYHKFASYLQHMPNSYYDIEKISKAVKGQLIQKSIINTPAVQHLLLDSRKISYPENSLFFAIKGKRHNGHGYIEEVYNKGVRNFIIGEQIDVTLFPEASFVL